MPSSGRKNRNGPRRPPNSASRPRRPPNPNNRGGGYSDDDYSDYSDDGSYYSNDGSYYSDDGDFDGGNKNNSKNKNPRNAPRGVPGPSPKHGSSDAAAPRGKKGAVPVKRPASDALDKPADPAPASQPSAPAAPPTKPNVSSGPDPSVFHYDIRRALNNALADERVVSLAAEGSVKLDVNELLPIVCAACDRISITTPETNKSIPVEIVQSATSNALRNVCRAQEIVAVIVDRFAQKASGFLKPLGRPPPPPPPPSQVPPTPQAAAKTPAAVAATPPASQKAPPPPPKPSKKAVPAAPVASAAAPPAPPAPPAPSKSKKAAQKKEPKAPPKPSAADTKDDKLDDKRKRREGPQDRVANAGSSDSANTSAPAAPPPLPTRPPPPPPSHLPQLRGVAGAKPPASVFGASFALGAGAAPITLVGLGGPSSSLFAPPNAPIPPHLALTATVPRNAAGASPNEAVSPVDSPARSPIDNGSFHVFDKRVPPTPLSSVVVSGGQQHGSTKGDRVSPTASAAAPMAPFGFAPPPPAPHQQHQHQHRFDHNGATGFAGPIGLPGQHPDNFSAAMSPYAISPLQGVVTSPSHHHHHLHHSHQQQQQQQQLLGGGVPVPSTPPLLAGVGGAPPAPAAPPLPLGPAAVAPHVNLARYATMTGVPREYCRAETITELFRNVLDIRRGDYFLNVKPIYEEQMIIISFNTPRAASVAMSNYRPGRAAKMNDSTCRLRPATLEEAETLIATFYQRLCAIESTALVAMETYDKTDRKQLKAGILTAHDRLTSVSAQLMEIDSEEQNDAQIVDSDRKEMLLQQRIELRNKLEEYEQLLKTLQLGTVEQVVRRSRSDKTGAQRKSNRTACTLLTDLADEDRFDTCPDPVQDPYTLLFMRGFESALPDHKLHLFLDPLQIDVKFLWRNPRNTDICLQLKSHSDVFAALRATECAGYKYCGVTISKE